MNGKWLSLHIRPRSRATWLPVLIIIIGMLMSPGSVATADKTQPSGYPPESAQAKQPQTEPVEPGPMLTPVPGSPDATSGSADAPPEPENILPDAPDALGPAFIFPSSGYVGWIYGRNGHKGLDIWSGDPRSNVNAPPCANGVRAARGGIVKAIYYQNSAGGWVSAPRGDARAAIVVLEHRDVPGAPTNPIYTMYLHMAKDPVSGSGTCISTALWDRLGQTIPAGHWLGQQGNMRLGGDPITHLHFSVSKSATREDTVDPTPFLGVNVLYGTTGALVYGDALAAPRSFDYLSGQISTSAHEEDSIYFYAVQGGKATIRMNRTSGQLDSYLMLYAPNGTPAGSFLAQNNDGGGNLNALLNNITLPSGGRYRIVAKSNGGLTTGGYNLSITLNAPRPSAPSNLAVTALDSSRIRVQWRDNSGVELGFAIYNGSNMVAAVPESPGAGATISYTAGGMPPNSWNCFTVYSYTRDQYSSFPGWTCTYTRPGTQYVVEETSSGFTKAGGPWYQANAGNNNHVFWACSNGNTTSAWGQWRANLPTTRSYEIYAHIPGYPYGSTDRAKYEIHHANGATNVTKAQWYGGWTSLGTYTFAAGSTGYIRLTNANGDPVSCNEAYRVGFDALQWVAR